MQELPKTPRGRATRERIVTAASELIAERGVAGTSLDDVIDRAAVSKGQLYHYFEDRTALLRAVIAHNADGVLDYVGGPHEGWDAIRRSFDSLVDLQVERQACGGCPVGSLVGQLAEADAQARAALADSFACWEATLRDSLRALQDAGELDPAADADKLATATLALIQGGLILTQTRRDPGQLAIALDAAYSQLRSQAV
jgi:TetR/AcrR family transcriptional repressor of nem operon